MGTTTKELSIQPPTYSTLNEIRKVWLEGNQLAARNSFNEVFSDFPSKIQGGMSVDFFCDVHVMSSALESNYQCARRSLTALDKVTPYLELINSPNIKVRYYNNNAVTHRCLGNFWEMFNYLEIAQELAENTDEMEMSKIITINLANAYTILGYYDQARAILESCLNHFEKSSYTWRIGMIFQLLGDLSIYEGNTGLAKSHLLISLDEFLKVGDNLDIAETYGFLARNANLSHDRKEARHYSELGMNLIGREADTPILAYCLTEYGRSFLIENDHEILNNALPALLEALEICQKHGHNFNSLSTYQALATVTAKIKDYEKAYYYEKSYNSLYRALRNGRTYAKIRHTEKIVEKKTTQLELENEKLRNKKLESLNDQLRVTLEDNELFMRILSHDLKNPLGSIYSVASMIDKDQLNQNQKKEVDWIYRESKRLHGLISELTRICRFENSWKPERKLIHLNDVIAQTLTPVYPRTVDKNIHIDFTYNPLKQIHLENDLRGISEIINNILICGIRFASENSTIRIILSETPQNANMKFSIPSSNIAELAGIFEDRKVSGNKYLHSGSIIYHLGLNLSNRIAERLNCSLGFNKTENEAVFEINIEKANTA